MLALRRSLKCVKHRDSYVASGIALLHILNISDRFSLKGKMGFHLSQTEEETGSVNEVAGQTPSSCLSHAKRKTCCLQTHQHRARLQPGTAEHFFSFIRSQAYVLIFCGSYKEWPRTFFLNFQIAGLCISFFSSFLKEYVFFLWFLSTMWRHCTDFFQRI